MKISELNTKIDIVKKLDDTGPVKNLEGAYAPVVKNIWAKKVKLLGQESIKLGLEHHTVRVNFIIRSRKGITESMYIQHQGVIYNIIGFEVLNDDTSFMLIATVKKQVIL